MKDPTPLDLESVKFIIVFDEDGEPLFSLSEQDYKNLATNTDRIKNYIQLQKKIIQLYRDYYETNPRNNLFVPFKSKSPKVIRIYRLKQ